MAWTENVCTVLGKESETEQHRIDQNKDIKT